jgi:hypothetical protein
VAKGEIRQWNCYSAFHLSTSGADPATIVERLMLFGDWPMSTLNPKQQKCELVSVYKDF